MGSRFRAVGNGGQLVIRARLRAASGSNGWSWRRPPGPRCPQASWRSLEVSLENCPSVSRADRGGGSGNVDRSGGSGNVDWSARIREHGSERRIRERGSERRIRERGSGPADQGAWIGACGSGSAVRSARIGSHGSELADRGSWIGADRIRRIGVAELSSLESRWADVYARPSATTRSSMTMP